METAPKRGTIKNNECAHQTIRFDGIRYGTITPTDIDALIEYHDIAVIIYEFKYIGAPMKDGQRIAIERIIDDIQDSGKYAIAFLCEHFVKDPSEDVYAKDALVNMVYFEREWHECRSETVNQKTDRFIKWVDSKTTY